MSDSHAPASVHLAAECLAALADEAPTAEQAAHLDACPACRREQEAYVALLDLARTEGAEAADGSLYAAERGHEAASPPASWDALAATLRTEGLVRTVADEAVADEAVADGAVAGAAARRAARAWARPAAWRGGGGVARGARLAASIALAAGAGAAGRWSAAHGPWAMVDVASAPRATNSVVVSYPSPETARAALVRARADYARAAAFLGDADPTGDFASGDSTTDSVTPRPARADRDAELLRARLAALDAMLPRVRAAAREAPQDPAVNHVYLTAYDAREAALRQLGRTLPAGVQLTGY